MTREYIDEAQRLRHENEALRRLLKDLAVKLAELAAICSTVLEYPPNGKPD